MKHLFLSAILAFTAVASFSAHAETKIAVINTAYIYQKAPQNEAITQRLKAEFSGRESEIKRLGQEIEKARTDYMNNVATMSQTQSTAKKREIEQKLSDIKLKQNAAKEDLAARQSAEQRALGQKVKTAVEKVAKAGGYNMLIDRQAALYIDSTVVDISEQVLAELAK